jgi:hypothetical protein
MDGQREPDPPVSHMHATIEQPTARRVKFKDWASFGQSVVTIVAIMLAGWLYFEQRESSLRANISQSVAHRQLTDEWAWVHVSTKLENVGKRVIQLNSGVVRVQKILPLDRKILSDLVEKKTNPILEGERLVNWPSPTPEYEQSLDILIESGEHHTVYSEFIIPSKIETIQVYSFFKNKALSTNRIFRYWETQPIGWSHVTIYDLKK